MVYVTPGLKCAQVIKQLLPSTHSIQLLDDNVIKVKIVRLVKSLPALKRNKPLHIGALLSQPLVFSEQKGKTKREREIPTHSMDTLEPQNTNLNHKLDTVDHTRNSLEAQLEETKENVCPV